MTGSDPAEPLSVRSIANNYWRGRRGPGLWTPPGSRQVASGEVIARLWPPVERTLVNGVVPLLGTPAWCDLDPVTDSDAYNAAIWFAAIKWSIHQCSMQTAVKEATVAVVSTCGRDIRAADRATRNRAEFYRANPDLMRKTS